jgi:RND family efflux transporter MFP subunit
LHSDARRTLSLAGAWLALCACGSAEPGPPPVSAREPAAAAGVAALPDGPRVVANGRIEGWQEADVAAKLPGRIVRFEADEGDRVAAGASVVQLEDRDLRARVRAAEARAREAKRVLERVRALREQGVESPSELERAESEQQSQAAALEEARALLDYATIRAPFDGTLIRRWKEVGESVTTGSAPDPLFRIADLSRLKVTAEVPERDVGAVRVGQRALVTTEAHPGERFPAVVRRVGLAVGRKLVRTEDPRERLHEKVIEVELELEADERLKSGMTVDVVVPLASG